MTTAAHTAEWICTRCGVTNRKLVAVRTHQTRDRCVTCHAKHVVDMDSRPVRWNARLSGKGGKVGKDGKGI